MCISHSFGNIIHFHDSPTQSLIYHFICCENLLQLHWSQFSTRQPGLYRERPVGLLIGSQSHSSSGSVHMCKRRLCGPAEWRTSMTELPLQRQKACFILFPATSRDHGSSFSQTITRCTPGNVTLLACVPKALWFRWSSVRFTASVLDFSSSCVKAAEYFYWLLGWWWESRGGRRHDCGVIAGHKQDSWDSMSVCRDVFSCSVWFPLWRTEYLRKKHTGLRYKTKKCTARVISLTHRQVHVDLLKIL